MEINMQRWIAFIGPLVMILAQIVSTKFTHYVNKRLMPSGKYSITTDKRKIDQEQIANMTIGVYGFFVSLIIFSLIVWIYSGVLKGIVETYSWFMIPVCFFYGY